MIQGLLLIRFRYRKKHIKGVYMKTILAFLAFY